MPRAKRAVKRPTQRPEFWGVLIVNTNRWATNAFGGPCSRERAEIGARYLNHSMSFRHVAMRMDDGPRY